MSRNWLETIERLRGAPHLGRTTPGLALLKWPSGSHFVFYRVDGNTLDVVRILHQSMDYAARLSDDL